MLNVYNIKIFETNNNWRHAQIPSSIIALFQLDFQSYVENIFKKTKFWWI